MSIFIYILARLHDYIMAHTHEYFVDRGDDYIYTCKDYILMSKGSSLACSMYDFRLSCRVILPNVENLTSNENSRLGTFSDNCP